MNILKHLQEEYHTKGILYLAEHVCEDPTQLKTLFDIYLKGDQTMQRRAAWALGHAAEIQPSLFKKYYPVLIEQLNKSGQHQSIYRCAFKCMEETELPEKYLSQVFDLSLRYLSSEFYEAAVRAFAIAVAARCAKPYPELSNELKLVLNTLIQESQSPAIKVRVRNALKYLTPKAAL